MDKHMDKYILITGGAGYIGSHVVKLFGECGKKIVVLDNLSTGVKKNILFGDLVVGDVGCEDDLNKIFSKYDVGAVIHFAGSISVPESVENPLKYYHNNTVNSHTLIKKCIDLKINNFIFSSTAATYGLGEGKPLDEDDLQKPINPYGHSKLMIERILKDTACAHKNFKYIALRYFNVAGADPEGKIGQSTPDATHLIKIASQVALGKRSELSIFGDDYNTPDGTCVRDYIHVMDLAQAHLDALNYLIREKTSNYMNCGYSKGFSVKEVISEMKKTLKIDFPIKMAPRRDGDPDILISKCEKIKKLTGWKPKYNDLSLMIKTAYDWEKKLS